MWGADTFVLDYLLMGPIVLSNISLWTQSTKSRLSHHPTQTSPLLDSYFVHSLDVKVGVKSLAALQSEVCLVYKLVCRMFFQISDPKRRGKDWTNMTGWCDAWQVTCVCRHGLAELGWAPCQQQCIKQGLATATITVHNSTEMEATDF